MSCLVLITMLNISYLLKTSNGKSLKQVTQLFPVIIFIVSVWIRTKTYGSAHGLAKWDKQNPTTFLQYPDLGSDIVRVTGDSTGYVWLSLEAPWVIRTNGNNWDTFQFTGNMWTTTIDIYNNFGWCWSLFDIGRVA